MTVIKDYEVELNEKSTPLTFSNKGFSLAATKGIWLNLKKLN